MQARERVVVVVGASRGIGRATALALAGPGMHLVLAARSTPALEDVAATLQQAGARASVVAGDIRNEPYAHHLMTTAAAIHGQIDVLINSAGGAVVKPFTDLSLEEWESSLRTNLTAVFLACKHAAPLMRSGGLIINVASVAARQAFPHWSAYVAAKHGLLGFSSAIREELRPQGIRVTTLLPAATDTDLWEQVPGSWNRANMLKADDVAQAIAQLVAAPVHVTTEELVIGHVVGRL